jgi:hypothetical protein
LKQQPINDVIEKIRQKVFRDLKKFTDKYLNGSANLSGHGQMTPSQLLIKTIAEQIRDNKDRKLMMKKDDDKNRFDMNKMKISHGMKGDPIEEDPIEVVPIEGVPTEGVPTEGVPTEGVQVATPVTPGFKSPPPPTKGPKSNDPLSLQIKMI